MRKSGLAFHCHHDKLAEYVHDYDERVKFIKNNKPDKEQALRLHLFQLISEDRIPGRASKLYEAYFKAGEAYFKAREACNKAREAYDKVWEAYDKAWEAYDKAWEAYNKAREAYDKAWEVCNKAWEAYFKAGEAYFKEYDAWTETLHKELCPKCPWDGYSIFPDRR